MPPIPLTDLEAVKPPAGEPLSAHALPEGLTFAGMFPGVPERAARWLTPTALEVDLPECVEVHHFDGRGRTGWLAWADSVLAGLTPAAAGRESDQ